MKLSAAVTSGSVFFFQAEDGIRDYDVTGVQTCALPIFDQTDACGPDACLDVGPAVGLAFRYHGHAE